AIVQQFLRGNSASSPSTMPPNRRRVSTRLNLQATRPSSSSNIICHRPGSTLDPAATTRSSVVLTNTHDHAVAVCILQHPTSKITTYHWKLRCLEVSGQGPNRI